jgi:DNA replication and repair protein RecF
VLAQAELYRRHVGDACILLIDDLPAELDPDNRVRVMRALAALDTQLFVTAIEPGLLDIAAGWDMRTFQLLQGERVEGHFAHSP